MEPLKQYHKKRDYCYDGSWKLRQELSAYKLAIRVFDKFPELKQRPYWGSHFLAEGYCVDTVGLDSEMIKKYVKYQEEK